jgi:hypothetical protein
MTFFGTMVINDVIIINDTNMRYCLLILFSLAIIGMPLSVHAQSEGPIADIITKEDLIKLDHNADDPINHSLKRRADTIYLTPKESKIIDMDQAVGSVVVANPAHASVFLDTPQKIVILPGEPGATEFTLLNQGGDEIFTRTIVVTERDTPLVRVRRICSDDDCAGDTVYYCPDICHMVAPTGGDLEEGGGMSGTSGGPAGGSEGEGGF